MNPQKLKKTRVFIVDDHIIFRQGLKVLLEEIDWVEHVGEAENGEDFLEMFKKQIADIVLMDIKMPKVNGINSTKLIKQRFPDLKIIALSMFGEGEYLEEIIQAGASGYLLKNVDKEELEKALSTVINGGNYYSQEMISVVTSSLINRKTDDKAKEIVSSFTERELEILELVCQGLNNIEIAKILDLSPRTVGGHRNNMLSKSGLKNTAALVSFAITNNIVKK